MMVTQHYLKQRFEYEPKTGQLVWKEWPRENFPNDQQWKRWNTRFAGRPFGGPDRTRRHIAGTLDNRGWLAHRLVFLWNHGYLPEYLDHIDGDRSNNRIENLRPCTLLQNRANVPLRKNNKTGIPGVYPCGNGRWRARISENGRRVYLGRFDTIFEAAAARISAENRVYGSFAPRNGVMK